MRQSRWVSDLTISMFMIWKKNGKYIGYCEKSSTCRALLSLPEYMKRRPCLVCTLVIIYTFDQFDIDQSMKTAPQLWVWLTRSDAKATYLDFYPIDMQHLFGINMIDMHCILCSPISDWCAAIFRSLTWQICSKPFFQVWLSRLLRGGSVVAWSPSSTSPPSFSLSEF